MDRDIAILSELAGPLLPFSCPNSEHAVRSCADNKNTYLKWLSLEVTFVVLQVVGAEIARGRFSKPSYWRRVLSTTDFTCSGSFVGVRIPLILVLRTKWLLCVLVSRIIESEGGDLLGEEILVEPKQGPPSCAVFSVALETESLHFLPEPLACHALLLGSILIEFLQNRCEGFVFPVLVIGVFQNFEITRKYVWKFSDSRLLSTTLIQLYEELD